MNKPLLFSTIVVAMLLGMSSAYVLFKPAPVQLQAATWFGQQARPLPDFDLTDHDGQAFNLTSMQDRWHLLFFGFTNCPDICPDTLQKMGDVLRQIEDDEIRQRLLMTFVSVDPERDSADKMKTYVTYFHPEMNSARGDLEAVNVLTNALGVLHYITKSDDGSTYDVAHSGVLTLIDPQGRYTALFNTPHDVAKIAADLQTLLQG